MKFTAVALLILMNVVAFSLPLFGIDTEPYIFSRESFFAGNYAVAATHMFLHANLLHLVVNMIALFAFGLPVEQQEGPLMLIAIYFVTGICAALLFSLVNPYAAVGASGAVFGLLAFVALTKPFEFSFFPFVLPLPMALIAVIYTLATLMLLNEPSNIGHWAHLGGILSGTALAFITNPTQAKSGLVVIGIMAALVLILPLLL